MVKGLDVGVEHHQAPGKIDTHAKVGVGPSAPVVGEIEEARTEEHVAEDQGSCSSGTRSLERKRRKF